MRQRPQKIDKGWIIVFTSILFIFSGVHSAFSASAVDKDSNLDPTLALPSFAADFGDEESLSIDDLEKLVFVESEGENEMEEIAEERVEPEATPAPAPRERPLVLSHTVRPGESLGSLSSRYGVSAATIFSFNRLRSRTLKPGLSLEIPSKDGIMVRVEKGLTLWDLARRYRSRLSDIIRFNRLSDPTSIRPGDLVFLPGGRHPEPVARPGRNGSGANIRLGGGAFVFPVAGGRLTSKYGIRRHPISRKVMFHRGIDIGMGMGASIRAVKDGVVVASSRRGGYGYVVDIRHANGVITRYAHNSKLTVRTGQRVRAGQEIAKMGSTGHSTGPHLHFEVIARGRRVDPAIYLSRR